MSAAAPLGSLIYSLFLFAVTPFYAIVSLLTFPLPLARRFRVISLWARMMVKAAELLCGIRYRVIGEENIPDEPCIILANHQSAFETFVFQLIFPPQVWVLKRELLWIPFFGWGLAMLAPIAIDRSAGARALRQTYEQGRDRLARGMWIVIFPEGTRVAPGEHRPYQSGGAWLASKTGVPVVPVAHNSGHCWPRKSWIKRPGVITVKIGKAMRPEGVGVNELNSRVEQWIRSEVAQLDHEHA